jgi:Family of unknown function (DUF6174)
MRWRMLVTVLMLVLTACGGSASSPTAIPTPATSPTQASATATPVTTNTPVAPTVPATNTVTPDITPAGAVAPTARVASPSGSSAAPSGTVSVANADMRTQLVAAEQRWQQSGASDYRIMVTTTTFNIAQTNTITVRGGKVADQSAMCNPLPSSGGKLCRVQQLPPETLTVPGLFAKARELIDGTSRQGTVTFDARYGYPTEISSRIPRVSDTESNEKVAGYEAIS